MYIQLKWNHVNGNHDNNNENGFSFVICFPLIYFYVIAVCFFMSFFVVVVVPFAALILFEFNWRLVEEKWKNNNKHNTMAPECVRIYYRYISVCVTDASKRTHFICAMWCDMVEGLRGWRVTVDRLLFRVIVSLVVFDFFFALCIMLHA